MRCFWDERQRAHAPRSEFFNGALHPAAEHAGRVDAILRDLGPTEAPADFGVEPLLRVHSPEYLRFLERAHAEWRGGSAAWNLVRRNQFTEVTGPGGLHGNEKPDTDPIWTIGWDHRSLILMVRHAGAWHSYRLPKASHSYDGAHGWNTEWPRIREIGERDLLMTMHGSFWRFPKNFTPGQSAGIAPRSNYLKVVGDFARWADRIVLGCDDTAASDPEIADLRDRSVAVAVEQHVGRLEIAVQH